MLVLIFFAGLAGGYIIYRVLYKPNVALKNHSLYLYIPTGSNYEKVASILKEKHILVSFTTFGWAAKVKHYDTKVKAGRYRITHRMSNNELVNLLRSGKQEPVRVTFQNIRTVAELAGRISRQIEADSLSMMKLIGNVDTMKSFGVTPLTAFTLFIPNTYEFYWNTGANAFLARMNSEKKKFWDGERQQLARKVGFSIPQIVILASIVEKETLKNNEKPLIAGVYINRLRKDWPLQADPTLVFAWQDFSIRRLLNKHKAIVSPYNTYLHKGLPPGPICLPSASSIDAVLNYKSHDYMFFCAKEDLSGYHAFAATSEEHARNAKRYQQALNRMNIR